MHVITRKLEFDAGHRVYLHESKCAHLHGHRYVVELSVTAADLDDLGRVIDFSVLKSVCGQWIDDNLDHGMMLFQHDKLVPLFVGPVQPTGFVDSEPIGEALPGGPLHGNKLFVMDKNPTAENIAEMLYHKFSELLEQYQIRVSSVKVWETPNCWAVFKG